MKFWRVVRAGLCAAVALPAAVRLTMRRILRTWWFLGAWPWPLRTARELVDDPAAEFQTENGKSLFRRKLTGDGIWILELEGRW